LIVGLASGQLFHSAVPQMATTAHQDLQICLIVFFFNRFRFKDLYNTAGSILLDLAELRFIFVFPHVRTELIPVLENIQ